MSIYSRLGWVRPPVRRFLSYTDFFSKALLGWSGAYHLLARLADVLRL